VGGIRIRVSIARSRFWGVLSFVTHAEILSKAPGYLKYCGNFRNFPNAASANVSGHQFVEHCPMLPRELVQPRGAEL